MITHEIFRVVSGFPRYIAESCLTLGQCGPWPLWSLEYLFMPDMDPGLYGPHGVPFHVRHGPWPITGPGVTFHARHGPEPVLALEYLFM